MNNTYPELVEALESQPPGRYILDGEIVAYEGDVTSFSRLQQRMKITDPDEARSSGVKVYLYVFDVLYYDGCDTTGLPLRNRKTLLRQGLEFEGPIRFVRHRNEHGQEYFKEACHRGWEGLIAKDARSKYVHSRSSKWLKFKCGHQQEFVIAGFTEPKGERVGFGALLIGYYDNDTKLRYAGKVGTGYDKRTLKDLRKRMERHEVTTPPFEDKKLPRKGVHWVKPRLVGEFGYTELTGEHRLRHPRFLGLRQDKKPKDVVLEGVQQT